MALGERCFAFLIAVRRVVEEIFVASDREPVDYGVDARNSARDHHSLVRFVFGVDPARELYDSVFDGADVHRALAEDGIIPERFENSLLELFDAVQRRLGGLDSNPS
jgi:hypothetical protein